jgi:hypothetical protein
MKLTEPPFATVSTSISLSVALVLGEDFSVLIWMSGMNYQLRANEMLFRGLSLYS